MAARAELLEELEALRGGQPRVPRCCHRISVAPPAPADQPRVADGGQVDDKTRSDLSFLPGLAKPGLVRHKLTLARPN
jgi:hypothetical protein